MGDGEQINSDQDSFLQNQDEPSVDSESDKATKFDPPTLPPVSTVSHATLCTDFALEEPDSASHNCLVKVMPLNS